MALWLRSVLQDLIKQLTLDMPANLIKGKNLLTISMPVRIFEPRSFLEKIVRSDATCTVESCT